MYSTEIVASISILSATHTLNKSYSFSGSSDSDLFFDAVGTLVIGSLDTISQFGGSYNFELAATRLNPTIVVQDIRAVSGIRIRHATGDPSDLIQGDVILQEGSNIQLYVDNNTIYISATGNDDYTGVCECSLQQSLTPIRTINGVSPNGSGNIQLTSDSSCLVISPNTGTNSIELQDSCSEPCCGCEELVTLTREIETLRLQLANLERYSDSLDQTIRQLEVTLAITGIGGDIQ
jgi:hypothetical protein